MDPTNPSEFTLYEDLAFPDPPNDRPYAYINMVQTIDGKTVSGNLDDDVLDLGSKVDHMLMKRIERSADAILIGAQTLRASPLQWNPAPPIRIVVTASGKVPWSSNYLSHGKRIVLAPRESTIANPADVQRMDLDHGYGESFRQLRKELGIRRLLVSGGSEVNAQLIAQGLVDELFVTIAPKVKLGRSIPTYAGGSPLPRNEMPSYKIVEHHAIGNELFVRYKRIF